MFYYHAYCKTVEGYTLIIIMISMIFVLRKQLIKELSRTHAVACNSKINHSLGISISRGTSLVYITFCLWYWLYRHKHRQAFDYHMYWYRWSRTCYFQIIYIHSVPMSQDMHLFSIHSLMELSTSWEAANCAATRELPSILCNLEVHYRVHISAPPVPILSQIDPIPTIPSYLSKIHFNILHPSTSWSFVLYYVQ
jgi:hypothetical protein